MLNTRIVSQESILNFIKVRGGVVNLRELSHFSSRDIDALRWEGYIRVGRGNSGIEVELLNNSVEKLNRTTVKEEVEKHYQSVERKMIEKKEIKRRTDDFSLKNKIFNTIKNAEYPLTANEVKKHLVQCNPDSISAYLSALVKTGAIVCSDDRKMFRHYTTPERKDMLVGLNKKPKTPKPKPVPVPVTTAELKEKLAKVERVNLKHKVLEIVVNSETPLTLQQVRSLLPEFSGRTISAYLSLFARQGFLCCSRITKNNIKYYTTSDRPQLFGEWIPKFGSQKVTARILSVLGETTIPLDVRGIVAQAQVSRKSAWAAIHKLEEKQLIELKRTGYSLHIVLKSNTTAMAALDKVSGYTLRDQVVQSIRNNNHHAKSILKDLINQYSLPHIHRVLRQMKSEGVLYSRIQGRYTLYFLNK